jgi:hypothetical protein
MIERCRRQHGGRASRMMANLRRAALHLLPFLTLVASGSGGADAQALALTGAKVYPSPTAAPFEDAVILTSGGVITTIGRRGEVQIPERSRIIDCAGKTVVAGFPLLMSGPRRGCGRALRVAPTHPRFFSHVAAAGLRSKVWVSVRMTLPERFSLMTAV